MTSSCSSIPPVDDDAFDAYIVQEGFCHIVSVAVMEQFLLRAAKRFQSLSAEQDLLIRQDEFLPDAKQNALRWLWQQFAVSTSDLRVFFSETEDYWQQTPMERKRLNTVADSLVCLALAKTPQSASAV